MARASTDELGELQKAAMEAVWVLAGGTPASDYAAALLGLIPQPHSPAPAASGRSRLRHRIVLW